MHKILAIDDKMDNLITLSALLKNLMPGCVVINAQSGLEGIAKAKAELPDAILLDVKMPDMDGLETCRRLMDDESTKHIPVIMITAIKTDAESRIEGLDCGANAFLAKPIDQYELVSQVKVALRIKKAEDALREERDSLERVVEERTASLRAEISERKRAEEHLIQSHNLLANLARLVPGVVYQYRLYPDGRSAFPYSSPGMNDIYEVTPEDVREDATPVFGRLHPDDYDHIVDSIQESARTLQTFYCEFRVILPRQGLRWRWSQAQPERLADGGTLWHGIISDITERKKTEADLNETLESLRKAVGTTIQVMVSAVEVRDPYTAGHQTRSANLAQAIATEMGLPQDIIDGIILAGSIHDIGKLSIPAEILSKPTKLSEIEFPLIKEHARRGFEILKDVESSWPLAEIVLQHHERMDGSGYPKGLKGEEIIMEARILAVADVVESMASHRPYRPALGLDAALAEIENNKGTLYDVDAVDACLRLFRDKGFQLEGT